MKTPTQNTACMKRLTSAIHVLVNCLGLSIFFAACLTVMSQTYQFMKENSYVDRWAREFVAKMTLEEKIGQMVQVDLLAIKDKTDITRYGIGSVLSGGDSDPSDISPKGWAETVDELQSYALKTRLGIPLLYGIDAVHGHNNVDGAVIFPHNIGLGATRNSKLAEKAARVTAIEMSATGIRWTFAPAVIVARDERWGRTYESYSEDPEVVGKLGGAAIRGFQTKNLKNRTAVLACAKHYLGDGGTLGGVDQGDTVCDEATLRRLFLVPYVHAVQAGVGSIMVSYSSWNGVKMHMNKYLLTDVLKGEIGFKGFLITDWAAFEQLPGDFKQQIEASVNAGLDMFMIPHGATHPAGYVRFIQLLKELVAEGRVPMSRIDDAVIRILRVKKELGLWERPFADRALLPKVGCAAHRDVARQCVRESLVLLKNDGGVLPLKRKGMRICVVGQVADDLGVQCGGWTVAWQGKTGKVINGGTTILEGMRQVGGKDYQIVYDPVGTNLPPSDVIVVVLGELPYAEGKGDRKDLRLVERDVQLVREAKKTGASVVLILICGRPLILGEVNDLCDAILVAWLPGTEGAGVADVLFGKFAPRGRLPFSWPRDMDQIPINVGDERYGPLYSYGYGLTYPHK